MKTFQLSCHVTVSAYTNVQAETIEQAVKIAASRAVEIGGTNTCVYDDESWVIEEADGEPQRIVEVE